MYHFNERFFYFLSALSIASIIVIPSIRSFTGASTIIYIPSVLWILYHSYSTRSNQASTNIQFFWWICLATLFAYLLLVSLMLNYTTHLVYSSFFFVSTISIGALGSLNWPRKFFANTVYIIIISGNVISIAIICGYIFGHAHKFTKFFDIDGYITIGIAIAISFCLSLPLTLKHKCAIWILSCLLSGFGLITVLSRGALLFSGIACFLIILVYWPNYRKRRELFLSIIFRIGAIWSVAVISVYVLPNRTIRGLKRLFCGNEFDTKRGDLWIDAINKIKEAPIFGHGFGFSNGGNLYPHNLFLQVGIDGGILSMLILLIIVAFPILVLYCAWRRGLLRDEPLPVALLCAYVFIFLEYSVSGDFYKARPFFIISSILIGYLSFLFNHQHTKQEF